ncbi:MAG: transporter substrate-binding domain-containing protein, partial [Cyanobacteria bacterium J06628_3]
MLGNDGNDLLVGGLGKDFLNGGSGADVFYFGSSNEGFDKILDFNPEQGDKIQVSASGFGINDLSGFRFISGVLDYNGQNLALIQNQGNTYSYFPDLTQIIEIVDQPTPISFSDNISDELAIPPQLERTFNIENPESAILDDIIARGKLLVAESKFSSDFDLEFARAISAVLFGDADKIEIVDEGEDIGATRFINNILLPGDDLSPVYFYDYEAIIVRQDSGINNALDLNGRTIGVVEEQASQALFDTLYINGDIEYKEQFYDSIDEMVAAYDRGEIDAYSTDS